MSQYIKSWKTGDTIFWRGPFGGFPYTANQVISITDSKQPLTLIHFWFLKMKGEKSINQSPLSWIIAAFVHLLFTIMTQKIQYTIKICSMLKSILCCNAFIKSKTNNYVWNQSRRTIIPTFGWGLWELKTAISRELHIGEGRGNAMWTNLQRVQGNWMLADITIIILKSLTAGVLWLYVIYSCNLKSWIKQHNGCRISDWRFWKCHLFEVIQ